MRTTVTIDDDVYEAAAHIASFSGERLGQVLSRLARNGLTPQGAQFKEAGRFPKFDVPPGAPSISAAAVQRLIDEDGIL